MKAIKSEIIKYKAKHGEVYLCEKKTYSEFKPNVRYRVQYQTGHNYHKTLNRALNEATCIKTLIEEDGYLPYIRGINDLGEDVEMIEIYRKASW